MSSLLPMQMLSRKATPQRSPNSDRLGTPRLFSPGTAAVRLIRRLLMVSGLLLGRDVPIPPEPLGMIRPAISRAMPQTSARRCALVALHLALDRRHRIPWLLLSLVTIIVGIGQKLPVVLMVNLVGMVRIALCKATVGMARIAPCRVIAGMARIVPCRVTAGIARIVPYKMTVATTVAMIGEHVATTVSLRAAITIVIRAATTGLAMRPVLPMVHLGRMRP